MEEPDPVAERAQSRVGTVLKEKWRIDKLLGVGGMAVVYAATHRNGKRVAVKMLHPEISLDANIRQRFLREGYVANKVGHRGAVTVDDDDTTEDGAAFLVMELLEGETLDARMRRKGGQLPEAEVLSLTDQVLDTLAAAHEQGIVHRDLKPENIFLTKDGVVKILDFGIARIRELSGKSSATQTGSLMGTPAFMAPEQARGRWDDVDARTDLWAVGATMFMLLTSRFVHEAETVNEALVLAVTARARSVATLEPGVHPLVVQLVDRALAYEKDARWHDAREMQDALRAAYTALEGGSRMAELSVPEAVVVADVGKSVPETVQKPATLTTGRGVSTTVGGSPARTDVPTDQTDAARRTKPLLVAGIGTGALLIVGAVVALSRGHAQPIPEAIPAASGPAVATPLLSAHLDEPMVAPAQRSSEPSKGEGTLHAVSVDSLPVEKSAAPDPAKAGKNEPSARTTKTGTLAVGATPVNGAASSQTKPTAVPSWLRSATTPTKPAPAADKKPSGGDPFSKRY